MATTLYLRVATAANPPTTGEKSTALPVGTANSNTGTGFEDLSLSTTIGSAQTSKQRTSLAQTAHQDGLIARFTSPALDAQTIAANTWTYGSAAVEPNSNANANWIASLYVWRPGTSAVVGFVYDSDTGLGAPQEFEVTDVAGRVFTFSGAEVTAQADDVLVFEVWYHAAQSKATAYALDFYFDGATKVVASQTSDIGSYIETPGTLTFGGGAPANKRRYSITLTGVG